MAERPNRPDLENLPQVDPPRQAGTFPAIDLSSIADPIELPDTTTDGNAPKHNAGTTSQQAASSTVPTGPIPVTNRGRGAGGRSGRLPRVSQAEAEQAAARRRAAGERAAYTASPQPSPTGQFVPVMPAQSHSPESLSRSGGRYYAEPKKRSWWKILLLLLLAAAVLYGVAWVIKENMKDKWDLSIRADSSDQVYEALTPTVSRDPFYMMLIGSDSRNDDENERSDTNIVARVDPTTGTVNVISIPRDTAINYGSYGTVKFNAAYAFDGASGAIRAAEGLLGIKITHYAEIDFAGLVSLVDAMGGIDVDVPMRIEDANAGTEVIEAGPQHLNGAQALVFARSRSYANGDYQRTANQRILVEAMLQKIMGMSDLELAPIIEELSNYMTSDMGVRQMQDYAILFQDYPEPLKIYSIVMPSDVAYDSEGVSYVVCDTETLRQVMQLVSQAQDPSYLITNDSAVYSSAEAEEMGMESTPIYVPD